MWESCLPLNTELQSLYDLLPPLSILYSLCLELELQPFQNFTWLHSWSLIPYPTDISIVLSSKVCFGLFWVFTQIPKNILNLKYAFLSEFWKTITLCHTKIRKSLSGQHCSSFFSLFFCTLRSLLWQVCLPIQWNPCFFMVFVVETLLCVYQVVSFVKTQRKTFPIFFCSLTEPVWQRFG